MSRYGNLGAFDYRVTNVPQYDLEADINKGIERGIKFGQMISSAKKSKEIERQKEIANQIALDKLDKATKEGLILPADSSTTSLNNARIDFSNKLVDKLNQAKIMRDDGSLTAADYSKIVMTLESQIPAYKAAEKVMTGGITTYIDALEDGKLSNANSPESIEFWSAIFGWPGWELFYMSGIALTIPCFLFIIYFCYGFVTNGSCFLLSLCATGQ